MHDVAFDTAEYFPAAQKVQRSDLLLEYEPIVHTMQFTDSFFARVPASQALQVVAPIVTLLVDDPAVHEMHPSVMELGAYLPLSHQTHSVRLKTYCPAEHIEQEVRSGLLNVPISHAVQSSILS